ncbi:hypothetical protein GCM10025787_08080 [Saccharopolyspora rosea]
MFAMPSPRGELLRFLYHISYPATREEIYRRCVEQGAPSALLDRLHRLPDGVYVEPDTVLQALPRECAE